MTRQLKLAFGKIILKPHDEIVDLLDYCYKVLEKIEPEKLNIKSNTILSFLDYNIEEINGTRFFMGFYGYAVGDKYKVIDRDRKTISKQDYPEPPFQSEALFLILESGDIIFEEKSESYIKPERIRDALERAFRVYEYRTPVKIRFLKLSENVDTIVEFINSLKKLTSIEYSNLKHSNPSEISKFFDQIVIARIDNIIETSNNPNGIDRENIEFLNQINHAKKYGKIRKAMGEAEDGFRIMELTEDEIHLTVTLKDQEVNTKILKMLDMFKHICEKLS